MYLFFSLLNKIGFIKKDKKTNEPPPVTKTKIANKKVYDFIHQYEPKNIENIANKVFESISQDDNKCLNKVSSIVLLYQSSVTDVTI